MSLICISGKEKKEKTQKAIFGFFLISSGVFRFSNNNHAEIRADWWQYINFLDPTSAFSKEMDRVDTSRLLTEVAGSTRLSIKISYISLHE